MRLLSFIFIFLIPLAATATNYRDVLTSETALGVGTRAPNSKSVLDLVSITKGILEPRMSTAQRNAIASPPEGLKVYDSTTHNGYTFDGTAWRRVVSIDNMDVGTFVDDGTPSTPSAGFTKLYSKSGVLYKVSSDGIETSLSQSHGTVVLSGSGTFTVPAGITSLVVIGSGGGGGGAGGSGNGNAGSQPSGGGAGGAGVPLTALTISTSPGASIAYSVGAGGAGGAGGHAGAGNTQNGVAGSTGGSTTFGSLTFKGGGGTAGTQVGVGTGSGNVPVSNFTTDFIGSTGGNGNSGGGGAPGKDTVLFNHGADQSAVGGIAGGAGGGGASLLGNGGAAGASKTASSPADNGLVGAGFGAGGGGGGACSRSNTSAFGGDGGAGGAGTLSVTW